MKKMQNTATIPRNARTTVVHSISSNSHKFCFGFLRGIMKCTRARPSKIQNANQNANEKENPRHRYRRIIGEVDAVERRSVAHVPLGSEAEAACGRSSDQAARGRVQTRCDLDRISRADSRWKNHERSHA